MGTLRYVLMLVLASSSFCQEKEKAPAGAQVQPDEKIPSQKTIDAILARINHFRKLAGLKEVTEDKDLSRGCQLHAEYIRLNPDSRGPAAHDESRDKPGFSEEGKKSATRSLVSRRLVEKQPELLVDALISTLYHRLPLINPLLSTVGIGYTRYGTGGYVVVADTAGKDQTFAVETWSPIVFPASEQTDVPRLYALGEREWPDPRPDTNQVAGYPITLIVAAHAWQPGEVEMSLVGAKGAVECVFSSPQKPALRERTQEGVFCLIPRRPLEPATIYSVIFKCKQIGIEKTPSWTKNWSFTTTSQ